MTIYDVIQARQPEVLEELRRRGLLRWHPGAAVESSVTVGGVAYRDVTAEATEAAAAYRAEMDHAAYRRDHGRLRQTRQVADA